MPKTKLGKWSVWCLGLLILFFIIVQIIIGSGQRGGDTFFDNLYISIPVALFALSGIFAFVFGLSSIIKNKERSPLVFIATIFGLLILAFIAGEFIGPAH